MGAALALFAEGATLPFVARYRKERTGGLDELQLRAVRERARYVRDLEGRRATVLPSIEEQDALGPDLRARIEAARTRHARGRLVGAVHGRAVAYHGSDRTIGFPMFEDTSGRGRG